MIDLTLDDSFDLMMQDGDLVTGESTLQHQELLLLTAKGSWREFPLRGVHLRNWMLDDQAGDINGAIKREFEADGMLVESINTSNGDINVDAAYE